jgi:hypothetical protein
MTTDDLKTVKVRVDALCDRLSRPTGRHDMTPDPQKAEAVEELRRLVALLEAVITLK